MENINMEMKHLIAKIRSAIKKHEDSIYYGDMQNVQKIIDDAYYDEAYKGDIDVVEREIEDRGDRWTHWNTSVYTFETDAETVYFKISIEEGRTEYQTGSMVVVEEVEARIVTITKYEPISQNKETI
jgi:hypothetical protein